MQAQTSRGRRHKPSKTNEDNRTAPATEMLYYTNVYQKNSTLKYSKS
jgi:hypothetical protein